MLFLLENALQFINLLRTNKSKAKKCNVKLRQWSKFLISSSQTDMTMKLGILHRKELFSFHVQYT